MKCCKPGTDQAVELKVYSNGVACLEQVLEDCETDPNTAKCYVSVKAGDCLTVKGTFSGSVLQASFDLIIDGSFLAESRIEGTQGQVKLYSNRKVEFKKVLQCPIPKGWSSIETPPDLFEGTAIVKRLSDEDEDKLFYHTTGGGAEVVGLGSIVVIVSLSQDAAQTYKHSYHDITAGQWRKRDLSIGMQRMIPAEYTIDVQIPPDGHKVSEKKSAKHRRNQTIARFGPSPWAKFIFYYRGQSTLEAAGCTSLSDEVREVDPDLSGRFIFSEDVVRPKERVGRAKGNIDAERNRSPSSSSSGLFVSSASSKLRRQQSHATEPRTFSPIIQTSDTFFTEPFMPEEGDWGSEKSFTSSEYRQALRQARSQGFDLSELLPSSDAPNEIKEEETSEPGTMEMIEERPITFVNSFQREHSAEDNLESTSNGEREQVSRQGQSEMLHELFDDREPSPQSGLTRRLSIDKPLDTDTGKLPSIEDVKSFFVVHGDHGIPGITLLNFFHRHGPYNDNVWAQREFQRRYQSIAIRNSISNNWSLKGDDSDSKARELRSKKRTAKPDSIDKSPSGGDRMTLKPAKMIALDRGKPAPIEDEASGKERSTAARPSTFTRNQTPDDSNPLFSATKPSPARKHNPGTSPTRYKPFKQIRIGSETNDALRKYENELQEKLALKAALRQKIQRHDARHKEEMRIRREEESHRRMDELRRELAEVDNELENLKKEEELKQRGEWQWEDDDGSEGMQDEGMDE